MGRNRKEVASDRKTVGDLKVGRTRQVFSKITSYPFTTLLANVATQVLPSNSLRCKARVHSLSSNANGAAARVRVGDSTVSLNRGIPLAAAETRDINTIGAVFCFSSATGQIVAVEEEVTA